MWQSDNAVPVHSSGQLSMTADRPAAHMGRAWLAALVGFGLVVPRTAPAALATGSPVVTDSGAESCPRAEDVQAEIVRLVPRRELSRLEPPVRIRLDDEGPSYVVRVFDGTTETERTHRDEGRHCASRARFAAVFAVLRLMPPEALVSSEQPATRDVDEAAAAGGRQTEEEPPHTDTTPSTTSAPQGNADVDANSDANSDAAAEPPTAPSERQAERTAGPSVAASARYSWMTPVGGAIEYLAPGVEAHLTIPIGGDRWMPVVAAGVDFPQRVEIAEPGIGGSVWGGDWGLGLRYLDPKHQVVPWFEGLLLGRVARWSGQELLENRASWQLSPGFRLAAGLGLRWGRVLVPCIEARGAWYPISSAVTAQPGGSIGRTATLELGIAAGAWWLP